MEYKEAVQAVAKYWEDLHTCKNELKRASEVVKGYRDSPLLWRRKNSILTLRGTRLKLIWKRPRLRCKSRIELFTLLLGSETCLRMN